MEVSGPEDDPFLLQLHPVQCPVCQQTMPAAHINSHLDRCLLLHPAGHAEPAAGPHRAGERAKGASPPGAKRRRLSESSALKQPATPTAAESSEGEGEEGDDGGETESRESYDAPPTPSGARLIPDFPVARSGSPGRKGSGKRPAAAAAAAGSASPRSWDEAEAPEEEEAVGDGDADADADGEEDAGRWDADAADAAAAAAAAAFGAAGGSRPHSRAPAAEEIRQMLEGKPLADKMRPESLQDYIGQSRAVGQETLLRSLLETNEIPSLILWGPPGCGKVSARVAGARVGAGRCGGGGGRGTSRPAPRCTCRPRSEQDVRSPCLCCGASPRPPAPLRGLVTTRHREGPLWKGKMAFLLRLLPCAEPTGVH